MGMAASQARYLALVARKSNCEFEGQQINQSRLLLSNQSADLFNQMLGLKVPVPPSTQDFTKIQYSYSDGFNTAVIDSWKQLSTNDPEYNYVVNSHYNTKVYTGSLKKMADPQVLISPPLSAGATPTDLSEILAKQAAVEMAKTVMDTRYEVWQTTKKAKESEIRRIMENAQSTYIRNNDSPINTSLCVATNWVVNAAGTQKVAHIESWPNVAGVRTHDKTYDYYLYDNATSIAPGDPEEPWAADILTQLNNMVELGMLSYADIGNAVSDATGTLTVITPDMLEYGAIPGSGFTAEQARILSTYAACVENDATGADTGNRYIVLAADVDNAIANSLTSPATPTAGDQASTITGYQYALTGASGTTTTLSDILNDIETNYQPLIDAKEQLYVDAKTAYETALQALKDLPQPTHLGNTPVTLLTELTKEQEAELKQVIADMKAQGIDTSITNGNYFDSDGNYLGGIYTFKMNGVNYYTTYEELWNSYSSYAQGNISNNYIDSQYKMAYYNASYIDTRIDSESRAILETDEQGRFKSIRFENDSVKYTLNMETITDDDAYQDAMNQYYYENARYDKLVQDINAKTSIIHQEDQQLELRLKQLETEQLALKTEIDAVQSIVKENVEKSFKTFS